MATLEATFRASAERAWALAEEQEGSPDESVYSCAPLNNERGRTFWDAAEIAKDWVDPDAGDLDRNHYDWFYPKAADVADPQWRADTRAKFTEALTDPFVHDAAKVTLALLDAYETCIESNVKR